MQMQLSPLQKTVDELLNLTTSINPGGKCFGSRNNEENLSRANVEETVPAVPEHVPVNNPNCEENTRQDFPSENERVELGLEVDSSILNDISNNNVVRNIGHTPRGRRNILESKRTELLENQTEVQLKILEMYKKIEKNTYNISRSLKKSCELQAERIELMKDHMHQQAVDNIEKRKFKIQEMEFKKRELDLKQEELTLMVNKNKD